MRAVPARAKERIFRRYMRQPRLFLAVPLFFRERVLIFLFWLFPAETSLLRLAFPCLSPPQELGVFRRLVLFEVRIVRFLPASRIVLPPFLFVLYAVRRDDFVL